MIIGKDKDRFKALAQRNINLEGIVLEAMTRLRREATDAKKYLESNGRSQKRKLGSMIGFCSNLLTLADDIESKAREEKK